MHVGLSRFFLETQKNLPGWTWDHNRALTLYLSRTGLKSTPGYREGVVLVSVPVGLLPGVKSRVVEVDPTTRFITKYESRVQGETPRRKTMALVRELPDPKFITVVLYHKDVLAEDNDRSCDTEWEVVTVLCQTDEDEPMAPSTLMANHFKADGGTATNMTPEQFEAALRKSYNYWKSRAMGITHEEAQQEEEQN